VVVSQSQLWCLIVDAGIWWHVFVAAEWLGRWCAGEEWAQHDWGPVGNLEEHSKPPACPDDADRKKGDYTVHSLSACIRSSVVWASVLTLLYIGKAIKLHSDRICIRGSSSKVHIPDWEWQIVWWRARDAGGALDSLHCNRLRQITITLRRCLLASFQSRNPETTSEAQATIYVQPTNLQTGMLEACTFIQLCLPAAE
jgi:hypothetical protein